MKRAAGADLNALMSRAEAAFARGAFAEAERCLSAIRPHAPRHLQVLHLSALVARRLGKAAEARRFFEQALTVDSRSPEVMSNYANLLNDEEESERALALYDRVLAIRPDFAAARLNKGAVLQKLGRHEEVLAHIAGMGPATAAAAAQIETIRGLSLLATERLDRAAEAFDLALEHQPKREKALVGRANVALQRGEAAAATLFRRALEVNPANREAALQLAEALEAEGDVTALAVMGRLVAAHPQWVEGQRVLARMRWEAGDREGHVAALEAELARSPGTAQLWFLLIDLLASTDQHGRAAEAASRARAACGNQPELLLLEASGLSEAGEWDAAAELFAKLEAAGRKGGVAQVRHCLRTGAWDEAAATVHGILADDPWSVQGWAYRSILWRLTGDSREEWLHGQPGLVSAARLNLSPGEIGGIAARLRSLHRTRAHPPGQSLRGGTQTRGRLFNRSEPEVARLREAVTAAVDAHWQALPPLDAGHPLLRHRDRRPRLDGSWSVRLTDSGFHVAHIHPHGVLSSASYLVVPEARDGEGWLEIGSRPHGLDLAVVPIAAIEPVPGGIALFPSTLFHGTRPFAAGERLTAAFDVVAG